MRLDFTRGAKKRLPPLALLGEGLLAGLAGTAVMTGAQTQLLPRLPIPEGPQPARKPNHPAEAEAKDEPATETAARRLVQGLAHRKLRSRQKKWAGNVVHFGFGALWGGVFALLRPRPKIVEGLAFGTFVWAVSDNGLLPLLRVASWPNRYPPGVHARALLAHLVYGAGTAWALRTAHEATRRRLA